MSEEPILHGGPDAPDLEDIDRKVRQLGWLKQLKKRIEDVLQARKRSIDNRIAWLEQEIETAAMIFRRESMMAEIPIASGKVTVKQKGASVVKNLDELFRWLEKNGHAKDEALLPRKWSLKEVAKRIEWGKFDEDGYAEAHWIGTAEIVPGLIKYKPPRGEFTVSIKPGDVAVVGSEESEEEELEEGGVF